MPYYLVSVCWSSPWGSSIYLMQDWQVPLAIHDAFFASKSIIRKHLFSSLGSVNMQLLKLYTVGKLIALTIIFVLIEMSLFFMILSKFVIAFLLFISSTLSTCIFESLQANILPSLNMQDKINFILIVCINLDFFFFNFTSYNELVQLYFQLMMWYCFHR